MNPRLNFYANIIRDLSLAPEYFIMDSQLTICAASNEFLYSLGDAQLINKPIQHLTGYTKSFMLDYQAIVRTMLNSNEIHFHYLRLKNINEHIAVNAVKITKIIDKQTKELIGFVNIMNTVKYCPTVIKLITCKHNPKFVRVNPLIFNYNIHNNNLLTEREQIICWLLFLNKTVKEIAYILGQIEQREISYNIVSSIISRSIFDKLNVTTQSELTNLLHKNSSILPAIPKKLFNYLTLFNFKINQLLSNILMLILID